MMMGPGLYMIFMVYVPNLPLAVKAAPITLFAYAAALAYLTFRNRKDYFYDVYLGICIAFLITCFTDSYAEFHGEVYEGF